MKVVALVSGGKDSCYAMMRCIHFGHEIVALANLLPENDSTDELDSYMYQTVGHQIVEAYATCMGLPLFRKRTHGKSKINELRYTATEGDEVEDLEMLLREVKEKIPSVTAVSSGAIASNYQRLRVENVCSRLGLVSLAYLWMQDQAELLKDMVDSGIKAILVKVAAMGLSPQKHLGKELSTLLPALSELHGQYDLNICGEGGEYESLTLDCPLFKNARIVLDEFDVVLSSTDSVVQVGHLHPKRFHIEPKTCEALEQDAVVYWVADSVKPLKEKQSQTTGLQQASESSGELREVVNELYVNITSWSKGPGQGLSPLLSLVHEQLLAQGLSWADVIYIHLYIKSMKEFVEVNNVYSHHITETECQQGVPSRSTVEVPLASWNLGEAMVEVLAAKNKTKRVLHVQSISCWAPSCIGPYSQATSHEGLLFMAGQIGLDPPTMALVTGGAIAETRQCFRNAEAVAQSFQSSVLRSSISIIVYCSLSTSSKERGDVGDFLASYWSRDDLPLVLYVLVSGLPKSASVEIEPLLLNHSTDDYNDNVEAAIRKKVTHSMPDFVDSSTGKLTVSSDCYIDPGSLCRTFLCLDCTSSTAVSKCAVQWMMELLKEIITDAGLRWSDLVALRVYYQQDRAVEEVEAVRQCIEAYFSAPVLVPVHGVGHHAALHDGLALDVLARRAR